jgi:hypothetical protein
VGISGRSQTGPILIPLRIGEKWISVWINTKRLHLVLRPRVRLAEPAQWPELFAGFVGYASAHWSYAAQSGAQKAPDLLDGEGTKMVACGTQREALKIIMRDDLKLTARNADINERFLTKPSLQCFDAKVKGNVGNHGSTTFDLACHFSTTLWRPGASSTIPA